MTRNKIKLEYLVDDSARRNTLKSRRASIFKKAGELSTLCAVDAGVVVYNREEANPAVWPSHEAMKRMLENFQSLSVIERSQKMVTHESYLTHRVTKETEKNKKEKRSNDRKEVQEIMNRVFEGTLDLNDLDLIRLNSLYLLSMEKMKQLDDREKEKAQRQVEVPPPRPFPLPLTLPLTLPLPRPPLPYPWRAPSPPLPLSPLPPPPPPPTRAACEMMGNEEAGMVQVAVSSENVTTNIPTSMELLMNDQWFMETMAINQEMPGPSGTGNESEDASGSTNPEDDHEDQGLPQDLNNSFPHIYSP